MSTEAVTGRPGRVAARPSLPSGLGAVGGVAVVLVAWQVLGAVFGDGGAVPSPTSVVAQMREDGFDYYWANVRTTGHEAALGWLWGNAVAVALAVAFLLAPVLERVLVRVAMASFCLPVIAIAPILQVLFQGATPKVLLAALSVFFTTLIGMLVGLKAADRTSLDVVHAYGGGSWAALRKVRLRSSLPSLFAALRIAAPAAVLGAIVGEYMGGNSGLGVAMVNAQETMQVERTWALALVGAGLSGVGYAVSAIAGRLLTPWAPRAAR